jgi:hypothetical protein
LFNNVRALLHSLLRWFASYGTMAGKEKLPSGHSYFKTITDGSNNLNQRYEIVNPKSPEDERRSPYGPCALELRASALPFRLCKENRSGRLSAHGSYSPPLEAILEGGRVSRQNSNRCFIFRTAVFFWCGKMWIVLRNLCEGESVRLALQCEAARNILSGLGVRVSYQMYHLCFRKRFAKRM